MYVYFQFHQQPQSRIFLYYPVAKAHRQFNSVFTS